MPWKKIITPLALLVPLAGAAILSGTGDSADSHPNELRAHIHTDRGLITVGLEPERAPLATAAFVGLAEGTIENQAFDEGRPYYDGTRFHRVVPGHVIQAGEPESERASDPGFVHPNEIHADLSHDRAGVLGVANSGPHTNSGQFYITLDDRSYLDGNYIVFGHVVDGMDVVHSIEQGDRVDSVRVSRRGPEAEAFRPDTRSFRARVREAEERVEALEEERRRLQEEWLRENVPGLEGDPNEVRTAPLSRTQGRAGPAPERAEPGAERAGMAAERAASTAEPHPARARYRATALEYRGHLLGHDGPSLEEVALVSARDGAPAWPGEPEAFPVPPDDAQLPEGVERVLGGLEPGEGVVAVVPPELGYGSSGYFGPEPDNPDEPRLVISPNTLLVYKLEVLEE